MWICQWSALTCADGYDEGFADDSEEKVADWPVVVSQFVTGG